MSFGQRSWVKLWVNEWLDGTTRYQMSDSQRAFWIDLLAMAGRSRFGGVVFSGRDGEKWIGYPLAKFQGLLSEPIDVLETFELFRRTEKITIEVSGDTPKLYVLFITNWVRYQSEYERVKAYRGKDTEKVQPKSQPESRKSNTTEVEVDVEREVETEKPTPCRECGRTDVHTHSRTAFSKQSRPKYPKRTDEFPTSRYREPVSVAAAEWDPHGFSAFWQAYPLKVHEDSAREAWNEIKPTAIEEVLAGIARWRRSSRWTKDDGQYIPNPETFLVKKSWRDEPKPDIERSLSPREALQKKNRETIERVRAKRPDSKKA